MDYVLRDFDSTEWHTAIGASELVVIARNISTTRAP